MLLLKSNAANERLKHRLLVAPGCTIALKNQLVSFLAKRICYKTVMFLLQTLHY